MKENADKLRALDSAEMVNKLREDGEQMFRLRFQMSMGQTDGVKKYRALRKDRARVLTLQRARALGLEGTPDAAAPAKGKKSKAAAEPVSEPKAAQTKPAAKKAAAAKASAKKPATAAKKPAAKKTKKDA
jgi:large subunit ribosomal protein L29